MNHLSQVTIPMPAKEIDRLNRLALRYGFSLEELAVRVLRELSSTTPAESIEDYKNPRELRASLNRALRDYRSGRVSNSL